MSAAKLLTSNILANDLEYILQHLADILREFAQCKILITGGTGFFGCWLIETLIWANNYYDLNITIVVLTRDSAKFRAKAPLLAQHPLLQLCEGDIRNFNLPCYDIAAIIHAATDASAALNHANPLLMFDTVVQGTHRILDIALKYHITKILYISSGAIYGQQPQHLTHIPETYLGAPDILNPSSAYAAAKRAAEHLCVLYATQHQLEIKIARCFAFVGAYLPLDLHFAVGNFIRDKLLARPIIIHSDGSSCRSYQYAADLVIWLFTILANGRSAYPYNVGSETSYNIQEIANCVANCGIPYVPVIVTGQTAPQHTPHRYIPNVARSTQELNLVNNFSLEESIQRTITWYQTTAYA